MSRHTINLIDKGNFITVERSDRTSKANYRKSEIVSIWYGSDRKTISISLNNTVPVSMNTDLDKFNGEEIKDFDSFVEILQDMIGSGSMNTDEYIFIDPKNVDLHEDNNVRLKLIDGVLTVQERKEGEWGTFIEF